MIDFVPMVEVSCSTTDVHGERIGIVKCDMADFLWVCGCRRECDNRYITKIDKVNRQASRIRTRVSSLVCLASFSCRIAASSIDLLDSSDDRNVWISSS